MTDLKKLRELASNIEGTAFDSEDFNSALLVDYVGYEGERHFGFEMPKSIRDFIAAANPETVIALLDIIKELKHQRDIYIALNRNITSELQAAKSIEANDADLEVIHE